MKKIQLLTSVLLASAVMIPCAWAQPAAGESAANLPSQRITNENANGTGAVLTLSPATVRRVQQRLNRLGYNAGNVDGAFDRPTRFALLHFQQARGLEPTGTLDEATLQALGVGIGAVAGGYGGMNGAYGNAGGMNGAYGNTGRMNVNPRIPGVGYSAGNISGVGNGVGNNELGGSGSGINSGIPPARGVGSGAAGNNGAGNGGSGSSGLVSPATGAGNLSGTATSGTADIETGIAK